MIYLVTNNLQLFESENYTIISLQEAQQMVHSWDVIQFDTETGGRNPHLVPLLCAQFGNRAAGVQIVVDCMNNNNILAFKEDLETKLLIGQNLCFDLKFLYNYGIIPTIVYDTMIVEQLLYLGFPYLKLTPSEYREMNMDYPYLEFGIGSGMTFNLSYSLKAIAKKYLDIDIDKTTRGEIIWRGLDDKVVLYAAGDVEPLEDIRDAQMKAVIKKDCEKAVELENKFVPVVAYMEWCGIKLDTEKWEQKMKSDQAKLNAATVALSEFMLKRPELSKFVNIDRQGDLFSGFDLTPKCNINWSSSTQVIQVAKLLGFNTTIQDKKTGEDKDSVLEKALAVQKGICDEFLDLYFKYQEYSKLVSSFGQGHLDAVNPKTGRIHTTYKQLGAASGRMSCGSTATDDDLAAFKKIPASRCKFPNMQQLPHDEFTRSCFIAEKGNKWVSCDWSAAEARLAGDIYNDQAVKDIFLNGIDSHSMYAKIFFKEQLEGVDVNDIKKQFPDLRQKAKGPEFALNFGGGVPAIMNSIQCSREEAEQIVKNYEEGFRGTAEFAKKASRAVRQLGYVLINPITGHKMYWWDWEHWKKQEDYYHSDDFSWTSYRQIHKGTGDAVERDVRTHFKAASKWDRMARNAPTQGTCAVMLKLSQIVVFNWVCKNGYFGKIKLCALVHDEANWEYPEEISDFPTKLENAMVQAAGKYCKSLPIPADAAVGDHWIH